MAERRTIEVDRSYGHIATGRSADGLHDLLLADERDPGCEPGPEVIYQYVELELAGKDAAVEFPGLAAHLRSCAACRLDHDGILDAARAELVNSPESSDA